MRFIKKRPQNRYVRPFRNYQVIRTVSVADPNNKVEEVVVSDKEKITENVDMDNRIEKINQILDVKKGPNKRASVKVEKKNQGLYERTEDSITLLNEDNKMLLKD